MLMKDTSLVNNFGMNVKNTGDFHASRMCPEYGETRKSIRANLEMVKKNFETN